MLAVKYGDNLQDAINSCFEGGPVVKSSNSIKKNETPSWLVEEKKPVIEETAIGWETGGFKTEERLQTANRRMRPNKVEAQ